ncbi:hypothetical protein PQX77_019503 [Marasmius sp. AFHP31]|nr:hypothetical protein PQX77_019503 [Marasmius sp. AFHP31]
MPSVSHVTSPITNALTVPINNASASPINNALTPVNNLESVTAIGSTNNSNISTSTLTVCDKELKINPRIFSIDKLKAALNRYQLVFVTPKACDANQMIRIASTDLIKVGGTDISQLLCEALIDSSAKGVMQSLLSTSFLPHQIPASAIQPIKRDDGEVLGYKVDETFAIVLWLKFQVLGTLVVVSANGLDRLGAADTPLAVPKDVFSSGEWDTVSGYIDPITHKHEPFPFIRLANPRANNPFLSAVFVSPDHVRNFFFDADQAFQELAKWTLDAIQRSFVLGSHSVINFGGVFFQRPEEYRRRTGYERRNPNANDNKGWELVPHPIHSSLSNDPSSNLSLILHPLYSSAVLNGTLESYDPRRAGFNPDVYAPSAYISEITELDMERMRPRKTARPLKRKRGDDGCDARIMKRARKTGGVM